MTLGTLYGLGYAKLKDDADLRALIGDQNIHLLVDIRYNPASRFRPAWSKNNTERTVLAAGIPRYVHEQRLGNPNFRDPGHMKLADPEGLSTVLEPLEQGLNVAVMCACHAYHTCHRQLVVEAVKVLHPQIEVRHLGEQQSVIGL